MTTKEQFKANNKALTYAPKDLNGVPVLVTLKTRKELEAYLKLDEEAMYGAIAKSIHDPDTKKPLMTEAEWKAELNIVSTAASRLIVESNSVGFTDMATLVKN